MEARGRSTSGTTTGEKLAEARLTMLEEWLQRVDATLNWQKRIHKNLMVEGWTARGHVIIVQRYGVAGADGWNIFTDGDTNSTVDSIDDAERRIGMRAKEATPAK